jgi:uncharacterized protein (TIGR02588 family)
VSRNEGRREETRAKRVLEALAALLGALLIAVTLGVILWDGLTSSNRPPFVAVEAGAVVTYPGGFVLAITARNEGDSTAADVLVEGELKRGQEVVESSEATFDYLPSRSSREGGLFFRQDPRHLELELSAKGYMEP